MEILAQFRNPPEFPASGDFATHLIRLWPVVDALAGSDERLKEWFLKGDTLEEALLYRAYEAPATPSTAVLAVLKQEYAKKMDRPKVFGFWNGLTHAKDSSTIKLAVDSKTFPNEVEIRLPAGGNAASGLEDYSILAKIVVDTVSAYRPCYVGVAPREYAEKKVFDDKPGMGWMLYLPHVLTASHVPEARALIPVHGEHGKQIGTIIVSVTDEVFSVDNPEHVRIANEIEIRLVSQDLVSRYSDY